MLEQQQVPLHCPISDFTHVMVSLLPTICAASAAGHLVIAIVGRLRFTCRQVSLIPMEPQVLPEPTHLTCNSNDFLKKQKQKKITHTHKKKEISF